jgi:hypothetical protein
MSFSRPRWHRATFIAGLSLLLVQPACTARDALGPDGATTQPPGTATVEEVDIALSPDSASVPLGQSVVFNVQAVMSDGTRRPATPTWWVSGGQIAADGRFTATQPGTYTVRATSKGRSKQGRVVVSQATAVSVKVSPDSSTVFTGAARSFSAVVTMTDGTTSTTPTWRATAGTIDAQGRYTAPSTAGTARVIATSGTVADTVTVTVVAPVLSMLDITPDTATVAASGTRQFAVDGIYSDGSRRTTSVTWSATGGTVSSTGLFTAGTQAGTFWVRAVSGAVRDSASVTVTVTAPTVTAIVLTPDSATVRSGQTRQFAAVARMSDGTTASAPITWSATRGTVSSSGLFTAGATPGSGRVIARWSNGTFADTARIIVPAEVTSCRVSPGSATLQPGGQQAFTVSAVYNDGSAQVTSGTWSATGGQVSTSGTYTAGQTAGSFQVSAQIAGGFTCSASVVIESTTTVPPPPSAGNWDLTTNRPSGTWTTVTDNPWSSLNAQGWGIATNRPGPAPSIVQDATAPDGDAFVLQQPYAGTTDGNEPKFPYLAWNASDEVFLSTIVKFAPTWVQPPRSGVKWLLFEGEGGAGLVGWAGLGAGNAPQGSGRAGEVLNGVPYWDWVFDASANAPFSGVAPSPRLRNEPLRQGQWHKLQVWIRRSPARVVMWVNDVKVTDTDELGQFTWSSASQRFSGIQFGATWGGGIGYSAPAGNILYHARTAIYRR